MWISDKMNRANLWISLIALIISMILSYFLAKTITGPIQQLIAKTKAVSAGDLTVHAESKSKDEVGILTRDFNQMVDNMKEMVEQVRLSSGKVSDTSEQLTAVSAETNETSGQIAKAIEEVAAGASEQASEKSRPLTKNQKACQRKSDKSLRRQAELKNAQNRLRMQAIKDLTRSASC